MEYKLDVRPHCDNYYQNIDTAKTVEELKFKPVSFGEMSRVVYLWQKHVNPETDCTPEKVFNYSRTGELSGVWFRFLDALGYFYENTDGMIFQEKK